jgi:hypothetical protein
MTGTLRDLGSVVLLPLLPMTVVRQHDIGHQ